jgi:hypothetical protein
MIAHIVSPPWGKRAPPGGTTFRGPILDMFLTTKPDLNCARSIWAANWFHVKQAEAWIHDS